MSTQSKDVAIAQLATYIILLPLIAYLLYAHGKRGLLGYLYLFVFCSMQLISAGLQIANPTSTTAAILSSVGLSPLLLGLAGIVHEAHIYLAQPSSGKAKCYWLFQIALHLLTIAAVIILALGTSNLAMDSRTSKYHSDLKDRKVGAIMLLFAFIAITAHASWAFLKYRINTNALAGKLLDSTIPALPLIFARLIYTVVYSFASPSSHIFDDLNPVTALIGIRIVFIFLLPLLAVLCLIFGALLSRHLPRAKDTLTGRDLELHRSAER